MATTNVTKYCVCHEKWPSKMWEKFRENTWNVIYTARRIRAWSETVPRMKPSVRNPLRNRGYFSRSPRAFSTEKYTISRSGCHSKLHGIRRLHQILRLPRKVAFPHHQILHLPRKVTRELYQILHQPRKLKCGLHQILRLPRKVLLELHQIFAPTKVILVLDATITWLYVLLDSTISWVFYYFTLLFVDSSITSLGVICFYHYLILYYLILLWLNSFITWL